MATKRTTILSALVGIFSVATLGGTVGCNDQNGGAPPGVDPHPSITPPEEIGGGIHVTPELSTVFLDGSTQRVRFRATTDRLSDISDRASWSLSDGSIGTLDKGVL